VYRQALILRAVLKAHAVIKIWCSGETEKLESIMGLPLVSSSRHLLYHGSSVKSIEGLISELHG